MKRSIRTLTAAPFLMAALLASFPAAATGQPVKDSTKAGKAVQKHDHEKDHKGHEDHKGHDEHGRHEEKATGTGKTDIKAISQALNENLTCLEKEIASTNHDVFHGCLETVGALGQDLILLKTPADPSRKKRVNGYAKNLGQMAHKVDEQMDAGQTEKAKSQLKKLRSQVELIEGQFKEPAKKPASGK